MNHLHNLGVVNDVGVIFLLWGAYIGVPENPVGGNTIEFCNLRNVLHKGLGTARLPFGNEVFGFDVERTAERLTVSMLRADQRKDPVADLVGPVRIANTATAVPMARTTSAIAHAIAISLPFESA